MITGEIKSKVDRLWDRFWSGGISNPLTVIEQMSYLLFIKRLDEIHTARELKANRTGKPIENPIFTPEQNHLRWSVFKDFDAEKMHTTLMVEVFPFIKNLGNKPDENTDASEENQENKYESSFTRYMKDAIFMIPTPALLVDVVEKINDIPMEDRDTKGDLYEYMLNKLSQAGTNGQFRTPKHIIKMMIELLQPKPNDIICDPACGTAGFLVTASEYLRENYPEVETNEELREHFNKNMFHGFDFDYSMLRISAMNMMLHGIENPNINYRDSLHEDYAQAQEECTIVLANPPFKGSINKTSIAKNLISEVATTKTELLFPILMLRLLKSGGRCAVIVPDGVLFGASNAHKKVREILVDNQKLEAVISMPSGVFKPYAGVSTGILIFTKTNSGGTDKVWFYDMQADGLSLDDKRNEIEANDIPDIIERFTNLKNEESRKRTDKSFFVPKGEIVSNGYDLSINRYKEVIYEEIQYASPRQILSEVSELENEIQQGINELKAMLG
ncbi:MAG: DNA methyltransferase [Candidatus Melainabacteria bacterium GWF2_37_15]|nr:MAG: DNA methyltransferase [Candidatus Melainabacteria bacterium GWF2_37_15]